MQALVQIEMAAMPNLYAPVSIPDNPFVYNASNALSWTRIVLFLILSQALKA